MRKAKAGASFWGTGYGITAEAGLPRLDSLMVWQRHDDNVCIG